MYYKKSNKLLQDYTTQEYLNKINSEIYSLELKIKKENGKIKFESTVNPTNYNTLNDILYSSTYSHSELICYTGSEKYSENEKEYIYRSTGHVYIYNIMTSNKNKNSVVVIDPYNSVFPHTII